MEKTPKRKLNILSGLDKVDYRDLNENFQIVENLEVGFSQVDVRDFGAKGNGIADDSTAITEAINFVGLKGGGTVIFPAGEYVISVPLVITMPNITLKGINATIKSTLSALIIEHDSITLEGLSFVLSVRNHSNEGLVGVLLAKKTGADTYRMMYNLSVKDCIFTNYTKSFELESCYWITLRNVHTFNDNVGFIANIQTRLLYPDGNQDGTTFYFDRVYFHGSNGSPIVAGSVGFKIQCVVNLYMNSCVSEWYDQAGHLFKNQNIKMTDTYLEICNQGVYILDVTGTCIIENTYFNQVKDYVFRGGYATFVITGGRGILETEAVFFDKIWESKYVEYSRPNFIGGGTLLGDSTKEGWDRQYTYHFGAEGVHLNDESSVVRVTNINGYGAVLDFEGLKHTSDEGTFLGKFGHGANEQTILELNRHGAFVQIMAFNEYLPENDEIYKHRFLVVKGATNVKDQVYFLLKQGNNDLIWKEVRIADRYLNMEERPNIPDAPRGGDMFFESVGKKPVYHDGSTWRYFSNDEVVEGL